MIAGMPSGAGTLIGGRFRLLGILGQGGMGRVWRGRDEFLDRDVAVKEVLLPPEMAEAERSRLIARTVREAKSAARLNHPGIVTIHDVIEHERVPWIVMEYVPGVPLGSVLKDEGTLSLQRAAAIGAEVADALAHAHAAGIVHRDLKPDNILVSGDRVVITDFGIARILDATSKMTSTGTIMGTPHFMAPEQLEGRQAGPAADLWSLGATLYLAIEGRPPFDGPTLTALITAVLTGDPAVPRQAGPLAKALARLLVKDPAHRPTAAAIAVMLDGSTGISPTGLAVPSQPLAGLTVGNPLPPPTAPARRTGPAPGPVFPYGLPDATYPVSSVPSALPALSASRASARFPARDAGKDLLVSGQRARRRSRHRTGLITAGAAVVFAAVGILAFVNRPAPSLTATGKVTATLTDPASKGVYSIAFGPDGTLATGDLNGKTYLWDTATGKLTATLTGDSVAFGPDDTLATGDGNGKTYLWDTATGKVTATLTDPASKGVNSVAFGAGGTLATGDGSESAYLWDTATGKLTATLNGPADTGGGLDSVAFGPDGTLATAYGIGSGIDDFNVYLWDTATGKLAATLTGSTGLVNSVAFGPGDILATGDSLGSTHLWNITYSGP
jgi:WD40 repeat protein/predicted Ser/Thr protein kinase